MKINSRALQQDLYQLMIDRESAHKISMSEEDGEYRLVYRKNMRETISYLEKSKKELENDYKVVKAILESIN